METTEPTDTARELLAEWLVCFDKDDFVEYLLDSILPAHGDYEAAVERARTMLYAFENPDMLDPSMRTNLDVLVRRAEIELAMVVDPTVLNAVLAHLPEDAVAKRKREQEDYRLYEAQPWQAIVERREGAWRCQVTGRFFEGGRSVRFHERTSDHEDVVVCLEELRRICNEILGTA
ncbi:MAG: hypothetical protein JJU45_18985 [Acidimicrobiia bacterium]|nr:hypothetical protein [Acidimicrobiia bacterium]